LNALSLLNTVFGYPAFRGRQAEVVEQVANGGDALVRRCDIDGSARSHRLRLPTPRPGRGPG